MSIFPPPQSLRRGCGAIGLAAFLIVPHLAEAGPTLRASPVLRATPRATMSALTQPTDGSTALGAAGVIERTSSTMPAACAPNDERLEQGREQLDAARTAREAARERVVEDHLRLTQEPTATIETAQDQEDLESARAEAHDTQQDVRQDEDQLFATPCSAVTLEAPLGPVDSDIVDVRMELPAKYLQSLEHALNSGSVAITAYRYTDRTAITGKFTGRLISVESALAGEKPIVIARARLSDSLHQLRDAEPVDVTVQLPAG